ncbi:MAG: hypothetical protein M1816_004644 [Peltula sp. TS41687]|nr:MAG: hypothetical protein M1816_004644 [Peltula sp. TS41687]
MTSTSNSTNPPPTSAQPVVGAGPERSPTRSLFEQQREALLGEIAISLEHVLQNINKLNRNLESAIAGLSTRRICLGRGRICAVVFYGRKLMVDVFVQVGNEFSSVEALWSQFENVMVRDTTTETEGKGTETRERDRDDDQEDRG